MDEWAPIFERLASEEDLRFALPDNVHGFSAHFWVREHTRDRLLRFLQRPFGVDMPFHFTERDRLYLTMTANANMDANLTQWTVEFLTWLQDHHIPGNTPAVVRLHLRNPQGGRVGGRATHQQTLDSIDNLSLAELLQNMNEGGYTGVVLSDCEIEFSFPVPYLINTFIRGGCIQQREPGQSLRMQVVDDQRRSMLIPRDLWLYRYPSWTSGQKSHLTSINLDTVPRFLGNLRGVYYYGWHTLWSRPVCGFMTVAYMVELFRFRVAHAQHDTFDTSNLEIWERDPHLLYLHACRLAETFPGMLREADGDMLSVRDLGALVNWLEPRCTLVVYDDSRRRLYTQQRTAFTVGNRELRDPASPFVAYALSPSLYHDYDFTRIAVFYDHTYRHYLPIFDTNRFFSMPHRRHWLPQSHTVPEPPPPPPPPQPSPQPAPGHHDNEDDVVVIGSTDSDEASLDATFIPPPLDSSTPTSSPPSSPQQAVGVDPPRRRANMPKYEYFIPCPCCDVLIIKSKIHEHVCRNALTCLSCGVTFGSRSKFREHQGEGYPMPCQRCHVKLYPGCERAHRRLCNNKRKLPRCPRCSGIYSVEPHRCLTYTCGRCGQRKRDLRVFNPCTGRWSQGQHTCMVRPSKQFSAAARLNSSRSGGGPHNATDFESQQDRLLYQLTCSRYFVFDFESMLDHRDGLVFPFVRQAPSERQLTEALQGDIHLSTVYIHRVNCVSFCELDLFGTLLQGYWQSDHSLQALVAKVQTFLNELEFRVIDIEALRRNPLRMFMQQESIPETPALLRRLQSIFKLLLRKQLKMTTVLDLDGFWKHVVEVSTAKTNVWYAHNLKGYDGRLLYDHLRARGVVPENMLWRGGKLFRLSYRLSEDCSVVFLDSMNHISTSLRKMPAMFGLDTSVVRKGMFPYRFNNAKYQTYRGALPDKIWFDVQWMRPAEYREFETWYNEQLTLVNRITTDTCDQGEEHARLRQAMIDRYWHAAPEVCPYTDEPKSFRTTGIYDLQTEMRLYCENDVYVLKLSLEQYHLLCITTTHCSPESAITVAQFTYLTYVNLFMPPDCIEFLDDNEYQFARRALRGGNTNVRQLYWEADPSIPGHGLRYIDVQSLYPSVQFYDPLPIGRPTIHYYLKYPETGAGDDDTPAVLKPQPSSSFLFSFFGFIECDLTPLKPSFHPVVLCSTSVFNEPTYLTTASSEAYHRDQPFRDAFVVVGETNGHDSEPQQPQHVSCGSGNGKLIGPLSPLRRVVITSVELQHGLEHGLYRVDRVYRIDNYRSSKELFKSFIRTWLKIKIINSPCPVPLHDTEAFGEFSRQCQERYHFTDPLTPDDFRGGPNVGLRNFAKLQLNSLWGKFGQRTTMDSHYILRTAEDHQRYATLCRIGDLMEVSSDWVDYGRPPCSPSTNAGTMSDTTETFGYLPVKVCVAKRLNELNSKNVAIASFVTAHARMRLWEKCHLMDDRVVYHDTDSMIYEVWDADEERVEEGHFLGDWESETGDRLIERFVSIAPKTYAYSERLDNGRLKDVVKSKGFFVHREAELFFNFEGYVALLVGSLLHMTVDMPELRERLEATFDRYRGLTNVMADYLFYESERLQCNAQLHPFLARWNRRHLTQLLEERFSVPGPLSTRASSPSRFVSDAVAKRRRLDTLLVANDATDDASVSFPADPDVREDVLDFQKRQWMIWKDMALPSRQLSIVHAKDQGVTLSYQCLKSMTFYYGKGLISADTLKTYPYGLLEQFPDFTDPCSYPGTKEDSGRPGCVDHARFFTFVGSTLVWPIQYNIQSVDFSYAPGGPQYQSARVTELEAPHAVEE